MKAQDVIDGIRYSLRLNLSAAEDAIVRAIDAAHKEIVLFRDWQWLRVRVNTAIPTTGSFTSADYYEFTLPLSGTLVDVDLVLEARDYTHGVYLVPIEDDPYPKPSGAPQFYRIVAGKLRVSPSNIAVADFRYQYKRKLYDVTDEDDTLLLPDNSLASSAIANLVLAKLYLPADKKEWKEHLDLYHGMMSQMIRSDNSYSGRGAAFVRPDPVTQE
jgi:hypothetical protein